LDKSKLGKFLRTVRHLKPVQVRFQLLNKLKCTPQPEVKKVLNASHLLFPIIVDIPKSRIANYEFEFLNIKHTFQDIDWNYAANGKLWTYNLNYFDFLHQPDMTEEVGLALIHDFCGKSASHKDGYEPYPISLRLINWVKFLSKFKIDDAQINNQLDQDAQRLLKQLEYHILANHLFENGFGLLFAAYYLQDEKLYETAKQLISAELKEQILADGAHYELTPMYHQILLFRILDAYQMVTKNNWKNQELDAELKSAASKMLGWINAIAFKNGDLPMVNDTTEGIAPSRQNLNNYATQSGISSTDLPLKESGYRKMNTGNLELFFDVGQIAPAYQPGHSHADSLQILLYRNSLPVLVDTGISTYEKNERRQLERSTSSHNTVTVNSENSSEVWSGFRVGRRAKVTLHQDSESEIKARHNGYRYKNVTHTRSISQNRDGFLITDLLTGKTNNNGVLGHLHFHPDRTVKIDQETVFVDGEPCIVFSNNPVIQILEYNYCLGYNKLKPAKKITYKINVEASFQLIK
jgi:hypothetical protein